MNPLQAAATDPRMNNKDQIEMIGSGRIDLRSGKRERRK